MFVGFLSREKISGTQVVGDKRISTVQAPRPQRKSFFFNLYFGTLSLLKGMRVTARYFFRPSTWVTQQYPENRQELKMFERYRAELTLKYDENGYHNCTGCKICDSACPNNSIKVIDREGPSGKQEIDRYIWRMDTCTFCNLCVMVCPHDALEMTGRFESSVLDRRLLVYQLNRYAGATKKNIEKSKDSESKDLLLKSFESRTFYEGAIPLSTSDEKGIFDGRI